MTVAVDRGILARSSHTGRCSPGFGSRSVQQYIIHARPFNFLLLLIYLHPSPASMRRPPFVNLTIAYNLCFICALGVAIWE
jgi:hypothetical protein